MQCVSHRRLSAAHVPCRSPAAATPAALFCHSRCTPCHHWLVARRSKLHSSSCSSSMRCRATDDFRDPQNQPSPDAPKPSEADQPSAVQDVSDTSSTSSTSSWHTADEEPSKSNRPFKPTHGPSTRPADSTSHPLPPVPIAAAPAGDQRLSSGTEVSNPAAAAAAKQSPTTQDPATSASADAETATPKDTTATDAEQPGGHPSTEAALEALLGDTTDQQAASATESAGDEQLADVGVEVSPEEAPLTPAQVTALRQQLRTIASNYERLDDRLDDVERSLLDLIKDVKSGVVVGGSAYTGASGGLNTNDSSEEDEGMGVIHKLQSSVTETLNSGYLQSVKALRETILAHEWDMHLKHHAARRGVSNFEHYCMQHDINIEYDTISQLYDDPTNLEVIPDKKQRSLARSVIENALDERYNSVYQACTDVAKDLANKGLKDLIPSDLGSAVDAAGKVAKTVLPIPGIFGGGGAGKK